MQPENRFDFHKQPMMLLSFIDTIEYIKKHDYKLMQDIEENNGMCCEKLSDKDSIIVFYEKRS